MREIFVVWGDFSPLTLGFFHYRPTGSPTVDSGGREGAGGAAHIPPVRGSRSTGTSEVMEVRTSTTRTTEPGEAGEAEGKHRNQDGRTQGMSPTKGKHGSTGTNGGFGTKPVRMQNSLYYILEFFYPWIAITMPGPVGSHTSFLSFHHPGFGISHLAWLLRRSGGMP